MIRTVSSIKYSFWYWTSSNKSVLEGIRRVIEGVVNSKSLNKSLLRVPTASTLSRGQLRVTVLELAQ